MAATPGSTCTAPSAAPSVRPAATETAPASPPPPRHRRPSRITVPSTRHVAYSAMMMPPSAIARGSPAKMISPRQTPSTPPHRSRPDSRTSGAVARATASSPSGTQLIPLTRPKCVRCAAIAPAKANVSPPRNDPSVPSRSPARRNPYIPADATAYVTTSPAVHAVMPGRTAKSHVSGYAAAAFQPASRGAPPQM